MNSPFSPFSPPFRPFTGTTGTTSGTTGTTTGTTGSTGKGSVSPSIFITFAVVAIAIVIIFFIHRILKTFFRTSHGVSSYQFSISRSRNRSTTATTRVLSEQEKLSLINALPLFTLSSSLRVVPKSRDCAICYETFLLDSELRLLPACYHAFHKPCADKWLKTNPSCPICRSSITLPFPPMELSSGSFRLEIGSVSKRSEPDNYQELQPVKEASTSIRSYSMDRDDYLIEDELEIPPHLIKHEEERETDIISLSDQAPGSPPALPPPPPPKEWLKEYLDKLVSSASSSFNSLRFGSQRSVGSQQSSQRWSQRWSQRFDSTNGGEAPPQDWLWDLEAGQSEEGRGIVALYRWFTGV